MARQIDMQWEHLTSKNGDLPVPPIDPNQTLATVFDVDNDGLSDIILGGRHQAPALVWLRPSAEGWSTYVVDPQEGMRLTVGGAFHDIEGDGYLDLVAGGDFQSNKLYWWKNPGPDYDPQVPWQRYEIKNEGGAGFHDQIFGDFDGDGQAELVFWNQKERSLCLSKIPADPTIEPWPYQMIFEDHEGKFPREGLSQGDIDGDGKIELLAGGYWFKHEGGLKFTPYAIDESLRDPRIQVGDLNGDGKLEVVMVSADHQSPLKWYECVGDPKDAAAWVAHDIAGFEVNHGHSLEIADFDGDGHLDILCAEMRQWSREEDDNPNSKMWIFYGDGKGNFEKTVVAEGFGIHEAKIGDFDGDGKPDICAKPFRWETNRIDVWLNRVRQRSNS